MKGEPPEPDWGLFMRFSERWHSGKPSPASGLHGAGSKMVPGLTGAMSHTCSPSERSAAALMG